MTLVMRRRLAATALLFPLAVGMAACGDDSIPQAGGDTKAKVAEGPKQSDALDFFTALASNDADQIDTARTAHTAPESIAEGYSLYLAGMIRAITASGQSLEAETVTEKGDDVQSCPPDVTGDDCTIWGNPVAEGSKIASFTVDEKPLGDRLSMANGKSVVVNFGGEVTPIATYKAATSENLQFVFSMKNTGKQPLTVDYGAAYVDTSGVQASAAEQYGPQALLPGALGYYALTFPNAKPGGAVTLTVREDGGDYRDAKLTVQTK